MKLIRLIIFVLLCIAFVPSLAFGDPLTYLAEDNSVTITDCNESASGALVIPSSYNGKPVISIGSYAFNSCRSLRSVTIPDSVTSIGRFAFGYCSSLRSVTIPDSVTSIGQDAFWDCSSLTSVTIPDSVTSIGNMAFKNCSSLTSVIIGNNVTSIGRWAFKGCHNLTNVTIPDSVTHIGGWAFSGCSSLKSITFEGNAPSSFGADVFKYLPIGATITVPAGATGFGETYAGLPVQILKKKLVIKSFNSHATPFSLTFETQSDSTYKVEASHDLKKWGEIGDVQGNGSSVKFIERRKAMFPQQYYRVKLVE
ncbi:MAG: leucine-rich repeat domain-containing protein [Verrucomicrobiota bacterium]|nr:leucine-rich repeat domain-containing protein [Verrucomicrobiota bacterium]